MNCLDSPHCNIVKTIEVDRDRFKSLYLVTDARMRAAEELIQQIDDDNQEGTRRVTDISYYGAYQQWKNMILAYDKVIKVKEIES